ncbi:acyl carrier protein [Alteromonas australica]|uniref:Acyl carrier protein n=1 Tax=Alteromonas australica TaxID=589873 RepID=A0A075NTY6_9ALTE|nr:MULTISPECIES: acyl carrier protein [Alteromonas]MAO29235.1 acyl carrier protein [Alteromonas sp.]AIF98129.1 acyl carrier protein [Alteromonas australica]AJP43176.1 acyl carrier protein [Alteromonas australica]QPL49142.1 acyl carrier protein [Alteromonas sp. B31-7]HBF70707.1 acyl carrier protein [Alteromonas australica]
MENKEKLTKAFTESLGIEPQLVTDELTYNTIPQWDSTAHMVLIAELENVFDVMLDTDDIIDLSSVAQAKIILQKYDDNIEFA